MSYLCKLVVTRGFFTEVYFELTMLLILRRMSKKRENGVVINDLSEFDAYTCRLENRTRRLE